MLALSACSPVAAFQSSVPPTVPLVAPTIAVVTVETPLPMATATATTAPSVTATRRPVATVVRATATPTLPQGVFVTAVGIDPLVAHSNDQPQFAATFLNTTGVAQPYRWFVKVYTPDDSSRSFGETSKVDGVFPIGSARLTSASDWKTQTFFDCLSFIARVFWIDADNQVHEFAKPDGSSPATGFTVCP